MWGIFSKKNRDVKKEVTKFVIGLEKLASIASLKTRRGENKLVMGVLKGVKDLTERLFELKKYNPDKYHYLLEQLNFSEEEFKLELPIRRSNFEETKPALESRFKRVEKDTNTQNRYREIKLLGVILSVYKQIWENAFKTRNEEVSRFTMYYVESLLEDLSHEPSNDSQLEQILGFFSDIIWTITKNTNDHKDYSIFTASIYWYTNTVFTRLNTEEKGFYLGYLDLFDRYIFSIIRSIVSHNQKYIFENIVITLIDGIVLPIQFPSEISEYQYILMNDFEKYEAIEKEINADIRFAQLEQDQKLIKTSEQLEKWIKSFKELTNELKPHYTKEQKVQANTLQKTIEQDAELVFKYNNLLDLMFSVGSYCIFKKRYDYIHFLWEYKQPSDADASWGGNDIVPSTLDEIIRYYFSRNSSLGHKFHFHEGHHGESIYINQYLLILLIKVLNNSRVEDFTLPNLPTIYNLSSIEYSTKILIGTAHKLKEKEQMLVESTGIETSKINTIIDDKLIPFLEKLQEKAKEKIGEQEEKQEISKNKLTKFNKQFIEEFNKNAIVRKILQSFTLYQDLTDIIPPKNIERFGINIVDDRAAFFDEWHVHYPDEGEVYGKDLASGENTFIIEKISQSCIEEENIDNAIKNIGNIENVFIINANIHPYTLSKELGSNYKSKWQLAGQTKQEFEFAGLYKNVPVYEIFTSRPRYTGLLVLDKSALGKLVQYAPLKEEDDQQYIDGIFYINIQDFSSNTALREEYLNKPPTWLQKIEDNKRTSYLNKLVLIQAYERIDFIPDDAFKGYTILLNKKK